MRKETVPARNYSLEAARLDVMVEPLPGHSDEEVATALRNCGAESVEVLAPGFISAQASGACLQKVEDIAEIHPKRDSQPH